MRADGTEVDEFLDQAFAAVRGRVRESLRRLGELERHKVLPVGVPQSDQEALNLCNAVLHDLYLPSATSMELVLATYLRGTLAAKMGRDR